MLNLYPAFTRIDALKTLNTHACAASIVMEQGNGNSIEGRYHNAQLQC